MHNRDRATPIALTRQAPIAQAVFGDALADAVLFAKCDGGVDRFIASLPLLTREPAVDRKPFLSSQERRLLPTLGEASSDGKYVGVIGRAYFAANSKSRSSCAGQPKIAPVP